MRKLYLLLLSLVLGAFLVSGCQTAQTASSGGVDEVTTTTLSPTTTTTTVTATTSTTEPTTTSTTTTSTTTSTVSVSINASQSTFMASNFPNTNYSTLVLNEVGFFTVPVAIESGFLYFDTSSIPSSATIISANLKLFISAVPHNITVYYYNCVVPWDASTLTWNNRPGAAGTPLTSKLYKTSDSGYVVVDITEGVQQWIDGTTYNYGLQLATIDTTTWNSMTYYSSTSSTNKPKLEVVYR